MNIPSRPPEAPADQESPYKSVGGARRVANALRYSLRGLILAWRVESAFRQELTLALVLLPIAFILPLSAFERLALIGSTLLVLIIELLNSSVEAAIDRISLDHHRLSGRAKDFGSAAVFLALLFCAFSWILIAGPLLVYEIARRL
jgi:diacylglycerol kinase (ATP)